MRFLIFVCLTLVLLNVVAYLWPDKANYAPHVASEKGDINANYVRLNKEIEDEYYRRSKKTDTQFYGPESKVQGLFASQDCYRVGPFVHQENYELAQAVLVDAKVDYKKAKRESKQSNVFRVYIGPYEDQAQAIDARTELRRKKIQDHFIRKNSEGQHVVSLGIYTTQESVDAAVELFSQQLDGVKSDNELVLLPESYWLYFALDDENEIGQKLRQVDWGERAAKMGKFGCQA